MVSIVNISKAKRLSKVYTFEQYLVREERSAEKHEFYNGKIIKMAGGTNIHSEITLNIGAALKTAVRPLSSKFRVYDSNLRIYVASANVGIYPDALIVATEPQFWQGRRDVITNPLLVVEVLSPSTQTYDRLGKFELYKQLPSFCEYMLVNTDTPSVETRFREEPDLWRIRTETDLQKNVVLRALGTSITMSDIYDNIF